MNAIIVWSIAFGSAVAALIWARRFYKAMMEEDEGTDLMREIAESVRQGADAYLKQHTSGCDCVCGRGHSALSRVLWLWTTKRVCSDRVLDRRFLFGIVGWFGMKTATQASSRTAAAARDSLDKDCKSPSAAVR